MAVEGTGDERWVPALQGVRGIAATLVLVYHVYGFLTPLLPVAPAVARFLWAFPQALTAFFVLSGFLLFKPYAEAAVGARPAPAARSVWWRRFLRIYPGHTAVLLIACVALPMSRLEYVTAQGRLPLEGLVPNLLLIQGYFPEWVLSGVGTSWTLVVEVTFYLLLPLLGWPAVVRRSWPLLLLPIVPMFAGGWIIREWAWAEIHGPGGAGPWARVLFYSFPGQMDQIAAGMLGAVVLAVLHGRPGQLAAWGLVAVGVAGAVVLPMGIPGNPLFAVGCAGVYVLVFRPRDRASRLLQRGLSLQPLGFLGRISYPTYLWHIPVMFGLLTWTSWVPTTSTAGLLEALVLVGSVTWVLSWLTTVLVIEPAIRLGNRSRPSGRQRRPAAPTLGT